MIFKGSGLVWDRENDKPLVQFVNGQADVSDERAINILKENGYGEIQIKPVTIQEEPSIIEDDVEAEPTLLNQEIKKPIVNAKKRKR
jgi:hypothetical protein